MDWSYFNQWEWADAKYLPSRGEGETMATQAVTAIAKLVYKWYNDGDVFDNRHWMNGWCNDLSSYANWLRKYITGTARILDGISGCYSDSDYENLLAELCRFVETEEKLAELDTHEKAGSIYKCVGPYKYVEPSDDDDDYDDYDGAEDE